MSRTPSTITLVSKEDRALAAYAGRFQKNHPDYRATLKSAALGRTVPLAKLRGALFGAMRCATTSNGQSMGRRRDAEQIERLWNRLPGSLAEVDVNPAPSPGIDLNAISDALEAAQARIRDLERTVAEQADLLVEQTDSRNRLTGEITTLQGANSEKQAALSYALSLLSPKRQWAVDGFIDGWNVGRA